MKIFVFTPAFCKAKLLEGCLEHIYKTPPKISFQHVVIDNHYPIDRDENSKEIKRLTDRYGCIYVDSGKDLGLHRGLNHAMKEVKFQAEDLFCGLDPDDSPSPGWLEIFSEVMSADPRLAAACAIFGVIKDRIKEQVPFDKRIIAGHEILIHHGIEMFNVIAIQGKVIHGMDGLHQENLYYGGFEIPLYQAWTRFGKYYGYLPEVNSESVLLDHTDRTLFDPEYRQWKTDHIGGFKGSFEEWLKGNPKI